MPSQEPRRAGKTFERGGEVSHRPVVVDTAGRIPPDVKTPQRSTSGLHLDAREAVAVVDALKQPKKTTSSLR